MLFLTPTPAIKGRNATPLIKALKGVVRECNHLRQHGGNRKPCFQFWGSFFSLFSGAPISGPICRSSGLQHQTGNTLLRQHLIGQIALPETLTWKKGEDPHPQDKIQHLDFTKDPRRFTTIPIPVYCTTKMYLVKPFSVLSKDEIGP